MTNTTPQRYPNGPRRFASSTPAELEAESIELVAELAESSPAFLPLTVRRVVYVVGLAGVVVAPVLALSSPELAGAIFTASSSLSAIGLGTALANPRM